MSFAQLAVYFQIVADERGISLRWKGDWDQSSKSKDEIFLDVVHFELVS